MWIVYSMCLLSIPVCVYFASVAQWPLRHIGAPTCACGRGVSYIICGYYYFLKTIFIIVLYLISECGASRARERRYREELARGADVEAAVTTMLATAGHTVFISGLTLSVCFAGLGLFPMSMCARV